MRLTLELNAEGKLHLPLHYNYYIQSFLYAHISPELAKFLHDEGFVLEKRTFKMFTFSRVQRKYKIVKDEIIFFLQCI